MMNLGLEEPLIWNSQIAAFNEISNEVERSKIEDDGLNRYSFVWRGDYEQRDARFCDLLRHLQSQFQQDPCWYLVWGTPNMNHPERDDPKIAHRTAEGWATHTGNLVSVGQMMVDLDTLKKPEPPFYKPLGHDGGVFLLYGDAPPAPDLTHPPVERTLCAFVKHRDLTPSSLFLSWVREHKVGLAYWARDSFGHQGLVVITPKMLTLSDLEKNKFATTVYEGDDAERVWHN